MTRTLKFLSILDNCYGPGNDRLDLSSSGLSTTMNAGRLRKGQTNERDQQD